MITVIAKNYIKEDKIEKMMVLGKELVNKTRAESGCMAYALFQNDEDKGLFTFIEQWQSKEALDKHFQTDHFTALVPQIEAISYKAAEVNILNKIFCAD
jgi:quinol monooxygenase YgiN